MSHAERPGAALPEALIVWDANPFNPYGGEVARILAGLGHRVRRYCRPETALQVADVDEQPIIPTSSGGRRGMRTVVGHLWALARFAIYAAVKRPVVVLPWTERHERLVFATLQRMGVRTVIVVHNPVPGRDEADADPRLARIRRRASALVVHTRRLVPAASRFGRVSVAPHPSYAGWAARMERLTRSQTPVEPSGRPQALYLGSARADKGFGNVSELAEHLGANGMDFRVAVGLLGEAERVKLLAKGNVLLPPSGTRYLSDEDVYACLRTASVLVAPYENVTVSGTVIMALTTGLPVVAFRSEAMNDLVGPDQLVEPGDLRELANRAAKAASQGRDKQGHGPVDRLDEMSSEGWRETVAGVQGASALQMTDPGRDGAGQDARGGSLIRPRELAGAVTTAQPRTRVRRGRDVSYEAERRSDG